MATTSSLLHAARGLLVLAATAIGGSAPSGDAAPAPPAAVAALAPAPGNDDTPLIAHR